MTDSPRCVCGHDKAAHWQITGQRHYAGGCTRACSCQNYHEGSVEDTTDAILDHHQAHRTAG